MHDPFLRDVLTNGNNLAILARWNDLTLPDGWLVAGCLFQTVWNLHSGFPPDAHIKDYDLFYFDGADLSQEGERRVQERVDTALADLGIVAEAKNQARVHLWYEDHFGHPYPQLHSTRAGIDRFLISGTCVGIRPNGIQMEVYAPNGLTQLYEGILSPNLLTNHALLFAEKAKSYRDRWPWLRVEESAPTPPESTGVASA